MNSKEKKLVKISYIIYYLLLITAMIYCYLNHNNNGMMMGLMASFTCFLVPLILKILGFKSVFEIYIINIIFAAIASILGSMLGAYSIPFFDKILHFSSGLFITELAYMIFCYFKKKIDFKTNDERKLAILFINACNMLVAVYWEFFEYFCLIFLNNDAIRHYTTGVHDTITDMLVACLGGFIITSRVVHYYRTNKSNYWIRLVDNFFENNKFK